MNTLPAPPEGHKSHTAASITKTFATASVMRPGDGLVIRESGSGFINFDFFEPATGSPGELRLLVGIHRIPAVIAELQRLMGES